MLRHVFGVVLLSVCSIGPLSSRQEPVELTVRHPAYTVRIQGRNHLVHELWISSRSSAAITLSGVTVLSQTGTVADYQEADLPQRVGRPGLPRNHPTPLLLEPQQQAIVYFWTPLDRDAPLPLRVSHRVAMTLAGSSSPQTALATGGATTVLPPDDVEVLDAPLRGPGWVAVYEPSMAGGHRTAIYTTDGAHRIPGRFAIDWIRLLPGATRLDPTSRPPDWNGFGAEVFAVRDARVAAAVDGHPDADAEGKPRVAITRENAAGNYVSLDLGNGRFAFYEHLQQGSVSVKVGDRVARGQPIARVGSSGSVSSGPHLHFHVSNGNSTLAAEGMPFVLRAFRVRGVFASIAAFAKGEAAVPNPGGLEADRSLERPASSAIVDFPVAR